MNLLADWHLMASIRFMMDFMKCLGMYKDKQISELPPSPEQFLARVEQQRQARECFYLLDLRNLSPDFCRRYSYLGRSMWLDATALEKFKEGLERNNGVFTVGDYEKILHAYHASNPDAETLNSQASRSDPFSEIGINPSGIHQTTGPSSVFELDYFEKRLEGDRVKHDMPVLLLYNALAIPAETRNISCLGLKVRAKTTIQVQTGDLINIRIHPTLVSDKKLPGARYRVVKVESLLHETILSLSCEEDISNETVNYFQQIVSSYTEKSLTPYNLDAEDALLTSYSTLAERYYMRSSTIIPLFLFKTSSKNAPLKIVFSNQNNLQSLAAFETSPGNYDLSPLAKHSFFKLLAKLAHRDSQADALLAIHRSKSSAQPITVIQSEFKECDDWYRFLSDHIDQSGFIVFRVVARHIHSPNSRRILSDIDQLATNSTYLAEKLMKEAEDLYIVGSLVDVTEQVRSWDLTQFQSDNPSDIPEINIFNEAPKPLHAPEIWPVSFIEENRTENRFIGQIRINIDLGGVNYSARTTDISTSGLSIISDDPDIPVEPGAKLLISFPDLKKGSRLIKNIRTSYRDIPYEVVAVERGNQTLLRVTYPSGGQSNRFLRTISSFIKQHRSKLPIELSHLYRSAASRFYSSHFVASSGTIPVFLLQKNTGPQLTTKIGIVQSPSCLNGFFEVAEGEFDFSILSEQGRLKKLVTKIEKDGRAELALFLYKERIPGTNRFRILQVEEHKVDKGRLQTCFVNCFFATDFRYIKLVASRPQSPPSVEIEQVIERLQNAPKSKTNKLLSDFSKLVAIGDIVDVTGQLHAVQSFSLYQKEAKKFRYVVDEKQAQQ